MATKKKVTTQRHWLLKSEPGCYGIDDLQRDTSTYWDGVRNYQARNFMRDDMQVGDEALFYHSGSEPPGVAGLCKISKAAYPDFTAWTDGHDHFNAKSTEENPVWVMVDVAFVSKFPRVIGLDELKANPNLEGLMVTKRGMRLSVQPVSPEHFAEIKKMAAKK